MYVSLRVLAGSALRNVARVPLRNSVMSGVCCEHFYDFLMQTPTSTAAFASGHMESDSGEEAVNVRLPEKRHRPGSW